MNDADDDGHVCRQHVSRQAVEPPTLTGRRVLVTAQRRGRELGSALTRRGADVLHAPVMSIVDHTDDDLLVAQTDEIIASAPDTVVVLTGVGFRGWLEAAEVTGRGEALVEALRGARLIARGAKARGAIQGAGLNADWVAESETSAEIRDVLLGEGVAGRRIAIQHHGAGADGLDADLADAGAQVRSCVVYRWGPAPDAALVDRSVHCVATGDVDAVVFTAAPGAAAFLRRATALGVADAVARQLGPDGDVLCAAVGPVTADPLVRAGAAPLVPERHRLGALVRALVAELERRPARGGRPSPHSPENR